MKIIFGALRSVGGFYIYIGTAPPHFVGGRRIKGYLIIGLYLHPGGARAFGVESLKFLNVKRGAMGAKRAGARPGGRGPVGAPPRSWGPIFEQKWGLDRGAPRAGGHFTGDPFGPPLSAISINLIF